MCLWMCFNEGLSYSVSVYMMTEAVKNMCVKDGYCNDVSVIVC